MDQFPVILIVGFLLIARSGADLYVLVCVRNAGLFQHAVDLAVLLVGVDTLTTRAERALLLGRGTR